MKRRCKHCSKEVEVESVCATVVMCKECREKLYDERYSTTDTPDFVYCRHCNLAKRVLKRHIVNFHKQTIEEYLLQFPNAPILATNTTLRKKSRSPESRTKTSKTSKEAWLRPEYRKRQIERMTGHKPYKITPEGMFRIMKSRNYKNSVKGYRIDIGRSVRSMYEANLCRIFDYMNVQYAYEKDYFEFKNGLTLIVDFYLYQDFEMFKKDSYLEFKGWISKNGNYCNKYKFDLLKQEFPKEYETLVMFTAVSDEWKYLEAKYQPLIPLWETITHNLRTHPEVYSNQVNEKESWTEYITCPLCIRAGEGVIRSRIKYLNYSHLKSHRYTKDQFVKEFPDVRLKVESLCEQHSQSLSKEKHFNFGKHLKEETKLKIASSVKENVVSEETRKKISKMMTERHRKNRLEREQKLMSSS